MEKTEFSNLFFPRGAIPRVEDVEMSGVGFAEAYNQILDEGGDNA